MARTAKKKLKILDEGVEIADDAEFLDFTGAGVAGGVVGLGVAETINGGGAGGGSINFSAGATSQDLAAITFADGNGISFGLNGSTMTASHNGLTSQLAQAISGSNGSFTFQTATFGNLNGLSFYTSNGSFVGSHNGLTTARASNDGVGLNTAQSNVTWTVNSAGLSLDARGYAGTNTTFNGANISGSMTVNSAGVNLSMSVAPGGGGADGYNILAAGTQTAATTGTVLFNNGNGITFGMANSSVITASHNGITSQSADTNKAGTGFTSAGNNIGLSGTLNTNGLSLSATVQAQSNQNMSLYALGNTTQNSSTVLNASNLSFNAIGSLTVGYSNGSIQFSAPSALTSQSNQAVSAANGSYAFQTLSMSNANGISFGTSAGSAITASHNGLTTARASNDGIGLNTAQSNVTWTVNSSGLSLDARGYAGTGTTGTNATFTLNSNGLQLNAGAYLTTAMASNRGSDFVQANAAFAGTNASGTIASNGISVSVAAGGGVNPAASASNGSFNFTTLNFSNANNVTFGTSAGSIITASVAAPGAAAENNWIHALGNNTAGNTTASGSTIGLSGINLTISGTNNSVFNLSVPATSSFIGTQGISLSTNGSTVSVGRVFQTMYVPSLAYSTVSQTLAALGATSASQRFFPFFVSDNLSFNALRVMHNLSYATSAGSGQQTISYHYGLYSNNGSTLSSISSGSLSLAVTNSSVSNTVSYPVSTNTAGYTYTTLSASTTALIQSYWGTAAGGRPLDLVFGNTMTLSSGQYWLGVMLRHSSSSANIGVSIGLAGNANALHNSVAPWGIQSSAQTTNFNYRGPLAGLGAYTASVSALTNAIPLSQIAHTQTIIPLVTFIST